MKLNKNIVLFLLLLLSFLFLFLFFLFSLFSQTEMHHVKIKLSIPSLRDTRRHFS